MIPPNEIAALWRQHANGLGLFARSRCAADAEDIVQEAFIRLAGQPAIPVDPLAWLAKTVRNLSIDAARRDGRRRARELRFAEHRACWFNESAQNASPIGAEELTDALGCLAPEERELLIAHLWNGMSFRQIADAFDLSTSTANRRYQEALKKMRKTLEADAPSGTTPSDALRRRNVLRLSHE